MAKESHNGKSCVIESRMHPAVRCLLWALLATLAALPCLLAGLLLSSGDVALAILVFATLSPGFLLGLTQSWPVLFGAIPRLTIDLENRQVVFQNMVETSPRRFWALLPRRHAEVICDLSDIEAVARMLVPFGPVTFIWTPQGRAGIPPGWVNAARTIKVLRSSCPEGHATGHSGNLWRQSILMVVIGLLAATGIIALLLALEVV